MNNLTLFLIILLILLLYILYYYFTLTSTVLITNASLNEVQDLISITSNPTSTRYAYGIWIYINSWDPNRNKTIFSRDGNMKVYFDKLSPVLKCDINMTQTDAETAIITDGFPLQKWSHIVVSADNDYFDFYLDGKLVKSVRAHEENSMPATPVENAKIRLGDSDDTFDAYVTQFYHWNQPIDPETAWKTYMAGNGQSAVSNAVGSYSVNLHVLKDNIEHTKFQLL
tara:strand:- start:439 stop:1116 length:678 start_codon:yes stop_codon:yes gene_type:complete